MLIKNLREQNLDWLFFGRVFIWNSTEKKKKELRLGVYFKILLQIIFSFFRKKKKVKKLTGGLFLIDNTRHFDQAEIIFPFLKNAFYHNNTLKTLEYGFKVNLVENIYPNYKKLIKYFFFFIREENSKGSKIFQTNLSLSIYGILLYETYVDFLKFHDIRYVVIFTDHTYKNRALMFAAKECGIKTVYIPHASVSEKFPPLETCLAFLEGEEMYKTYVEINRRFKIEITPDIIYSGNLKVNSSKRKKNLKKEKNKLGIAFNIGDKIEKVEETIIQILKNSLFDGYTIIVRPHPQLDYQNKFKDERIIFSDSKSENSIDYLNRLDFLLSGDSNIILEACLLYIPSFIIPFSESFDDNYGFGAKKICPIVSSIEDLKPFLTAGLENFIFNKEMLSQFDFSFKRELNSGKLIANRLNTLIHNH